MNFIATLALKKPKNPPKLKENKNLKMPKYPYLK